MYDNNEEKIGKKASEKAPDQGNVPDKLPCFLKNTKTKLAKAQLEQSKLQLQYVLYQNVQLARVSDVNNTSGKVRLGIYEPREFEINGTELTKYKGKSKKVVIPYGVTSIGKKAFSKCSSLTNIIISDSVTSIGYRAFEGCVNLKIIIIPNSVTSIGSGAFYNCNSLTSITIPDSVTSIGGYAFSDCRSLTSITIPDSVTSIEWGAFSDCRSLTSITIPDSVTSIDEEAFFGCSSLTSITIPNGVKSIGDGAFSYCSNLKRIIFQGTQAQWNAITKGTKWRSGAGKFVIQYTE